MNGAPRFTLAICSRNRPDGLRVAVAASLKMLPADAELLVIDQTDEPTLNLGGGDQRLRYEHRPGAGIAISRNTALRMAASSVVVFTDDDCAPRIGMVEALAAAFTHDRVAIAFGTVVAEADSSGFIPSYYPLRAQLLTGRRAKLHDGGIGACMAVRRGVALSLGGFDERFGPGAPLGSNEEGEFSYRTLRAGYALAHVPEAIVDHVGLRLWNEGRQYSFETYRAIGATFAMYLRIGDPVASLLLAQQVGFVLLELGAAFVATGRLSGLSKLRGLLAGMRRGFALRPREAIASPTGEAMQPSNV